MRGFVMAVLLTGTAACGAQTVPSTSSAGSAAAASATFTISRYAFPAMVVAPGATVTVMNDDDEPHTVTADDGTFTTPSFDGSAPGTFTAPTTPGSYPFHCTIHTSMHGILVVQQP